MSTETLIILIVLGALIIAGIGAIIIAIIRGELKKFIIEQMEKAGELFKDLPKPERSVKKFQYVLNAVKEKYKLVELFMNVKKFIELIVNINNKKM